MTCRHFGTCGGCQFQDRSNDDYRALKKDMIVRAFARAGLAVDAPDPVSVPPGTRRRATFKAVKTEQGVILGFHAGQSHEIVDMAECPVLTPSLVRLVPGLRAMLDDVLDHRETAELNLTDTPVGGDLSLRWAHKTDSTTLTKLSTWSGKLGLARIARHGETLVETEKPYVTFGPARVFIPSEVFLQPTEEGERILRDFVVAALAKCKSVIDLFAGCGTFSLPLAEKARVHAVELEGDHLDALALGARQPGFKPVTTQKRNLFRQPVGESELTGFDGVCLDPPRAGALEQVRVLAGPLVGSKIKKIAYVSCDAETFARDALVLLAGGWKMTKLAAVDQFLWSSRIELTALFVRRSL